jgi:hypothetical protein
VLCQLRPAKEDRRAVDHAPSPRFHHHGATGGIAEVENDTISMSDYTKPERFRLSLLSLALEHRQRVGKPGCRRHSPLLVGVDPGKLGPERTATPSERADDDWIRQGNGERFAGGGDAQPIPFAGETHELRRHAGSRATVISIFIVTVGISDYILFST